VSPIVKVIVACAPLHLRHDVSKIWNTPPGAVICPSRKAPLLPAEPSAAETPMNAMWPKSAARTAPPLEVVALHRTNCEKQTNNLACSLVMTMAPPSVALRSVNEEYETLTSVLTQLPWQVILVRATSDDEAPVLRWFGH
jgi:hypothetical protein